jgi:hypothetical protein
MWHLIHYKWNFDKTPIETSLINLYYYEECKGVGCHPVLPLPRSALPVRYCRRFETGGSLDRRVKCRRVPQPRWVGARRSATGEKAAGERERWKSRGLCVRPAPRSGALAVGGYKRSTREGASGLMRAPVPSSSSRGQPPVRGPWSFLL